MPDYKTGSYLMIPNKSWCCEACKQNISAGVKLFARITCFGPVKKNKRGQDYQEKVYVRWHLKCALALTDLSEYEHELLGEYFKMLQPEPEPAKDYA